mgnify:CR=1 FL=1
MNAATQTFPTGFSPFAMSKETLGRAARLAVFAALAWTVALLVFFPLFWMMNPIDSASIFYML